MSLKIDRSQQRSIQGLKSNPNKAPQTGQKLPGTVTPTRTGVAHQGDAFENRAATATASKSAQKLPCLQPSLPQSTASATKDHTDAPVPSDKKGPSTTKFGEPGAPWAAKTASHTTGGLSDHGTTTASSTVDHARRARHADQGGMSESLRRQWLQATGQLPRTVPPQPVINGM